MIRFKKTELKNGIRVVSEAHPQSKAVSIGLWVGTGTRDESSSEAGMSHFLEHMVFKGTKTRSAYQIAKSLEALGGELNAYTSREYTCYHAHILKDYWEKGIEILSDLVSNMDISRADFILEKSVVMQEISMGEDNLEELIYDKYLSQALVNHPLSKPILGTENSIKSLTQKQLYSFYKRNYSGRNIIISASGNIDHQELVDSVQKYLGRKESRKFKNRRTKPRHKAFRLVEEKNAEQLHMLLGFPVTSFRDSQRFEAFVVNAMLGGGMTSKLYQSIREKRGLVYSIYSSLHTFVDFGLINIYAATDEKQIRSVVKNISNELKRIRKHKISSHDLEMFKTQIMGSIMLGSDDVDNRMNSIAINEMVFGKYKPIEEIIEEIANVSVKSVNSFADRWLDPDQVGGVLLGGNANKHKEWFENFNFREGR